MKSAIILNGSPRPHGNTTTVVKWLSNDLRKHDWQINSHNLYTLNIRGCSHCNKCKSIEEAPGCVIKDDLIEILNQIVAANMLVVASPVYCWKVSGCMSNAIDRFYSLFKEGRNLIKNKQILGVFTAGGDHFDGVDLCVEMLKRICDFSGAKYAGTVAATYCTSPEELEKRESLKREISQLAGQI